MSEWPEKWFDLPLAVFDLETTGFDAEKCQVIEIGIVQFFRGEVVKVFNWLVDPECEIPEEIVNLTHITQEDVTGQPKLRDIAGDILDAFKGHGIVAYNVSFDRPFLTRKLNDMGLEWPNENPIFDPLIYANHFFTTGKNKLGLVAERLGISLEGAHRACNDAEATGKVFYAFRDRLPESLEGLLLAQAQWEREYLDTHSWVNRKGGINPLSSIMSGDSSSKGITAAFAYASETDVFRALYSMVPNAAPRNKNTSDN